MKLLLLQFLMISLLAPGRAVATDSNLVHVALVFDDGPLPGHTDKLLALFAAEQIHVTFGSTATNVESQPTLARAVVAAGHEIANHSYTHRHPKDLDDATLEHEIVDAQNVIAATSGFRPKWYWPPFLESDARHPATVARARIEVFTPRHLVVSEDYNRQVSAADIKRKATTGVTDGTVILFHEWRDETLDQLPAILAELRRQHCVILTFSQLAEYCRALKPSPAAAP
jgi:peptidoglycan/xylan/chitin deacetylase (PgdA/CDA1 family)